MRLPIPKYEKTMLEKDLISQLISALKNFYCLPDRLPDLERLLIKKFDKINIKPITQENSEDFLDAVNKTLNEFDPHLELKHAPDFIREKKQELDGIIKEDNSWKFRIGNPPLAILEKMNNFRGSDEQNYGFILTPPDQVTIPDDVGYLKINYALDISLPLVGDNAKKAATNAMEALKGKEKIIIDLRNVNEGGSPEMIQYLVSFFISKKDVLINQIEDKRSKETISYKTVETPFKLEAKSVSILTDKTTFSALEELAYDLQQFGKHVEKSERFMIIGNNSRGGANPAYSFPLTNYEKGEINPDFVIFIPCCRSVNPYTETNWENTGVKPDIVISSGQDALDVALSGRKLLAEKSRFFTSSKELNLNSLQKKTKIKTLNC